MIQKVMSEISIDDLSGIMNKLQNDKSFTEVLDKVQQRLKK